MTARDVARRALLEAAILKELTEANAATRDELSQSGMEPGDKVSAGDLGYVQITSPKPVWKVVDLAALTKWIEDNAPDMGIITRVEINRHFVAQLVKAGGEFVTADGEVLQADGLGLVSGQPTLRVVPSDQAHEAARQLLGSQLQIEAS